MHSLQLLSAVFFVVGVAASAYSEEEEEVIYIMEAPTSSEESSENRFDSRPARVLSKSLCGSCKQLSSSVESESEEEIQLQQAIESLPHRAGPSGRFSPRLRTGSRTLDPCADWPRVRLSLHGPPDCPVLLASPPPLGTVKDQSHDS
ncbi:hypothetical protein M3Y99_00113800 [Aphelenchoides fujianensis]|nr:hypothetical protein M3Y99_00113800 [Aphelenchoides fujianensis]